MLSLKSASFEYICTLLLFINNSAHGLDDFKNECAEMFVSQDGPVTLDVPITFQVNLTCALDDKMYTYSFQDDADPPHKLKMDGPQNVSASFIYPENTYSAGQYCMTVTAFMINSSEIELASSNITFLVTEYIPGNLTITGVSRKYDQLYASSGIAVNMTIEIHFPEQIFKVSEFSYSWNIGDEQFISSVPFTSHIFEVPGVYGIHVAIVVRIPLYDDNHALQDVKYKWRYFREEINVKDPFTAINLTGNAYLQHGDMFIMNVSCDGSGPYQYCWKVLDRKDDSKNLTCLSPVVTNQCMFPIIYYFHQAGDYEVAIHIDNFLTEMQRNVQVHVYDVRKQGQLSTVIIPLFCSVLVVLIIAAGVMLHVRRNQQINIETADFDFLQSDTCVIETFWERLFRSILNALWLGRCISTRSYLCLDNKEQTESCNQFDSTNSD